MRTKRIPILFVIAGLAVLSAVAVAVCYRNGWILYYGDAEAHLNTARRIVESRTPGPDQFGSPWLPLPHLLMLPFVIHDNLWHSGLAGAIPSAACFVIAGTFLFAAARRIFSSDIAALTAVALYALNPNVLYLQSTPMSEPIFAAALLGMLYFTVLFRDNQQWWAAVGAGVACLAGTLARYDGWFLIPAVTLYVLFAARRHRWLMAALVGGIASFGPMAWLAHNWFWYGDALYFYRGPGSAVAIQGGKPYPGMANWKLADLYYRTAVFLCTGPALRWIATAGILAALFRRAFWPIVFLVLPGVFYLWSMHSTGGSPIHVPGLWPSSASGDAYYNTRYGLALMPFAVFAASALVTLVPLRAQRWAAIAIVVAASIPWFLHPTPESWITWKESQVNSESRREWTRQAAAYLGPRYHPGDGIFTSFGDITAIYRTIGIPLRETLTWDNDPAWTAARYRPDLFLHEEWAVCFGGDPVQSAINRALRQGPDYVLVDRIVVKGAQVLEIYRRSLKHENPVH